GYRRRLPGSRARSAGAGAAPGLRRRAARHAHGPGEPPHLAAVPRLLLPAGGPEQPVALGRPVPARSLWPLDARGRLLRHAPRAPPRGRGPAAVFPVGPGSPPAQASLRAPHRGALPPRGARGGGGGAAPPGGPFRAPLRRGGGGGGLPPPRADGRGGNPAAP